MDFTGTVDALVTHATAAGRALPNRITDVAFAHPLPKGSRCIRLYYDGEQEPVRLGGQRVLNGEMVCERLVIVAFWALSGGSETLAKTVEHEVRVLKHELRTRIQGDSRLGGKSTDLELGYAETDFVNVLGTAYRVLRMDVLTDYEEYPIAP